MAVVFGTCSSLNMSKLCLDVFPSDTGEDGKAVEIDKEKLSPEDRKKYDEGFQNNAFNEFASKMMSVHRSLPDIRDEE